MKLKKDIYLNSDKILNTAKIKISYNGQLLNNNPAHIFLHYGYGPFWENVQDIELYKTDVGYQNEIIVNGKDEFNFCFFDENNNWDNNYGQNYSFPIEEKNEEIKELNDVIQENIDKKLSLVLYKDGFGKKFKVAFNKIIKSIPNLFKRMAKAK